nr:MAG TPA: hypothetical protein [Caudoviricetes sp.]
MVQQTYRHFNFLGFSLIWEPFYYVRKGAKNILITR